MVERILVPVDRSKQAREACAYTTSQFPDADVDLLHVINPADAGYGAQASIPTISEEWYEREREQAEGLLTDRREEIDDDVGDVRTEIVVGKPARAIVEYANDHDVDQIVMGSHGRSGVSRILLGSVAENVVRNASVPVTVAR